MLIAVADTLCRYLSRRMYLVVCCAGFLAVIFYETITPVNIIITVLVPLWVAWAFSKNILKSPILWGIIVMLPLKYPPGIPIWF